MHTRQRIVGEQAEDLDAARRADVDVGARRFADPTFVVGQHRKSHREEPFGERPLLGSRDETRPMREDDGWIRRFAGGRKPEGGRQCRVARLN